jgi:hypothetical protein
VTTNFDLAPPPVAVGGLTVVPVDLSTVVARLVFDAAAATVAGDATITFTVGPTGGRPMFDLRQEVTGVWLDGAPLALASVLTRDLGGGTGAAMRVLDVELPAGGTHTLRLTYDVGLGGLSPGGGYPPNLVWSAGPRLAWNAGFTDLAPGRYLEAWVPANLIWDQYSISVELSLAGTGVAHSVITNGVTTVLGTNHWRVDFPSSSTATSTLLEIRATDTLRHSSGVVAMPSGASVTIDAWKLASNTGLSLAAQITSIGSWLAANEAAIGGYAHGARFVAFLIQGGMEYDGGCTASTGSLRHEVFHSWWGRAIRPASQADGWFDEGWTTYHDSGGVGVTPLDFGAAPLTLCNRNPYSRLTPGAAYSGGNALFKGIAAITSPAALNGWMAELYSTRHDRPITTLDLESHLLARSGQPDVVDAFHRFVYGLPDSAPAPNLWIRDDPAHAGSEQWSGRFWDSPDLWIRNTDDGGLTHQAPIAGQDNFFYARVRNQGSATARHFMVTFQIRQFAGVQFTWPTDFMPAITATGGFDLAPGGERIVSARWPAAGVPPAGAHACWLAAVLSRGDRPITGRHVWEHGNLAQKNLTILAAAPDSWLIVPFIVRALGRGKVGVLELRLPSTFEAITAELVGRRPQRPFPPRPPFAAPGDAAIDVGIPELDDCGRAPADHRTAADADTSGAGLFDGTPVATFTSGLRRRVRVPLPVGPAPLALRLHVPRSTRPGASGVIDLVQLDPRQRPVGGIAVELRVKR